jgi:hypothetical protein
MKPQGTTSGAAGFHGQIAMDEGGAASVWKVWTPKRSGLTSNRGLVRIQIVRDIKLVSGNLESCSLLESLRVRHRKHILISTFTKTINQGQARMPYSHNPRMENRMN